MRLHQVLFDQYVAAQPRRPRRVVLDFDATDVPLHGDQEGRFFHGYYDRYCYLPLYVFCGRHLLVAYLRRSDIDAAQLGYPGAASQGATSAARDVVGTRKSAAHGKTNHEIPSRLRTYYASPRATRALRTTTDPCNARCVGLWAGGLRSRLGRLEMTENHRADRPSTRVSLWPASACCSPRPKRGTLRLWPDSLSGNANVS